MKNPTYVCGIFLRRVSILIFLQRIKSKRLRSVGSFCCEALAAINRFAFGRLEGHLALLAALRANSCEHFSRTSLRILLCGAALFTSGGFILESSGCIEFLLTCGEHEIIATIFALQCLVLVHGSFFPHLIGIKFALSRISTNAFVNNALP